MPMNRFTEESAFLEHYERARKIARFAGNHIRTCDGENLLGRPRKTDDGSPLMHNGRTVWEVFPRNGYIPDGRNGAWKPVPWLAHHLQSTLVRLDDTQGVSIRLTPEIRIMRNPNAPAEKMLIRSLIVEIKVRSDVPLTGELARQFMETTKPFAKLWYPLHERVAEEWMAQDAVTPMDDGYTYADLLVRYFADHETLPGART